MINILLNSIGAFLIFKWLKNHRNDYKQLKNKIDFFALKRFRSLLISMFVILTPILVINFTDIETKNYLTDSVINQNKKTLATIVSFMISLVWLVYIYKLDVFNKEQKRYLILIMFLTSILTSFAEIPYRIIHSLGFTDSEEVIGSFLYSVFGIGLIEETIKFIPILILLRTTKAINESYDYILYASVSALGFSFIENSMYLTKYGIEIINARALYATVAHMTFSSILAYGLYLIKYKKTKYPSSLVFLAFCFLAIFSHGFYDFWLINKTVSAFSGLTTLFFLATVHVWFLIKNNTINTSEYFNKNITIQNDQIKTYLSISLLTILMFSYVFVAFKWDSNTANVFLLKSIYVYGYIIFYLIATLSKFDLVNGLIKPIRLSIKYLIPK